MTFQVWVSMVLSGPFGIIKQVEKSTCNFLLPSNATLSSWSSGHTQNPSSIGGTVNQRTSDSVHGYHHVARLVWFR